MREPPCDIKQPSLHPLADRFRPIATVGVQPNLPHIKDRRKGEESSFQWNCGREKSSRERRSWSAELHVFFVYLHLYCWSVASCLWVLFYFIQDTQITTESHHLFSVLHSLFYLNSHSLVPLRHGHLTLTSCVFSASARLPSFYGRESESSLPSHCSQVLSAEDVPMQKQVYVWEDRGRV